MFVNISPYARIFHRSPPQQIEYWATISKISEENPDLPLRFVKDVLIGLAGVCVYKYEVADKQFLLAHRYKKKPDCMTLLALGSHENFYRDLSI